MNWLTVGSAEAERNLTTLMTQQSKARHSAPPENIGLNSTAVSQAPIFLQTVSPEGEGGHRLVKRWAVAGPSTSTVRAFSFCDDEQHVNLYRTHHSPLPSPTPHPCLRRLSWKSKSRRSRKSKSHQTMNSSSWSSFSGKRKDPVYVAFLLCVRALCISLQLLLYR